MYTTKHKEEGVMVRKYCVCDVPLYTSTDVLEEFFHLRLTHCLLSHTKVRSLCM